MKQSELIENLIDLNKETLTVLANYMNVENYESKLNETINNITN